MFAEDRREMLAVDADSDVCHLLPNVPVLEYDAVHGACSPGVCDGAYLSGVGVTAGEVQRTGTMT